METKIDCCKETVRKVLAAKGLFFKGKRKFVVTTDSKHRQPVAENILARNFTADAPNQKWVADITYIPTQEGWLYLAAVMDLYSRKIVGWSMGETIDTTLVKNALEMAIEKRSPGAGLLHYSDRGVQYASNGFQEILRATNIRCSMSRKGNCWDTQRPWRVVGSSGCCPKGTEQDAKCNAVMESFFGKLKVEQVYGQVYRTRHEAELDIFRYIEVFYNRIRRHASLGYVSPDEFEQRGEINKQRAA